MIRRPSSNATQANCLQEAIRGKHVPGRALLIFRMGERSQHHLSGAAVWLAGHRCRGNLSDVAVAQAKARAAQLHVTLTAIVDDLDHYELGKSSSGI